MTKLEIQSLIKAAKSVIHGTKGQFNKETQSLQVELPFNRGTANPLYYFIIKRSRNKHVSLILPSISMGILPTPSTLSILQKLLTSYGISLLEEGIIAEENYNKPLNVRLAAMAQALLGIDGVVRLWNSRPTET